MCAGPVSASAQSIPGGLFGTVRGDGTTRDKLEVMVTLNGGYDSELPPELTGRLTGQDSPFGGISSGLLLSADYARQRRLVDFSTRATTHLTYYPRLDRVDAYRHNLSANAVFRLPARSRLDVSQTASYSPSYLYELLPGSSAATTGVVTPEMLEYRLDLQDSYSYRTNAGLTLGAERNTRFSVSGQYVRTEFESARALRPERDRFGADARLTHVKSRATRLWLGYTYSTADLSRDGRIKEHRAPLGVEYSSALTPSRRVAFRLEVAPTMFDAVEDDGVERQVTTFQGQASVEYPFHLKWRVSAGYRRATQYVAILDEPMITNGVDVKLEGLLGRRFDVSAIARSANAESALATSAQPLDTYMGEFRLRFALSRSLALFSEYAYYYFDLGEQHPFLETLPRIYRQHGVRAGVMLFTQVGR